MNGTKSTEGLAYRVETTDGNNAGHSDTSKGAKRMADENDRLAPDDAPHQVREVPEDEVHENGKGIHPIVYPDT